MPLYYANFNKNRKMSNTQKHIVKCSSCGGHFPFACEDNYNGNVTCPDCNAVMLYTECEFLTLCPHCTTKLALPYEMLNEKAIQCPTCHKLFPYKPTSDINIPAKNKAHLIKDGTIINNYRIDCFIGAGGMAEVYRATHLLLNTKYAIKVMKPDVYSDDPMQTKRFIREAQLAQKADHPNIVKVYDVGYNKETNLLYIAMEFVEGENLENYTKKHKLTSDMLLHIAQEVTKALIAMHKQGIVHRDIKPSNIMLCNDGSIKLMDLGIAKATANEHNDVSTLTMEQSVLGTPAYASPEQCRSAKSVDIRSDIYCLGASLYHLATGRPPYGGTTALEILLKVLESIPRPLEEVRPDLSPALTTLIRQMMDKQPDKRPQTPEELYDRLTSIDSTGAVQKEKWPILAGIAMGVLLLIVLVVVLMPHGKTEKESSESMVSEMVAVAPKEEPKKQESTPALQEPEKPAETSRQEKAQESAQKPATKKKIKIITPEEQKKYSERVREIMTENANLENVDFAELSEAIANGADLPQIHEEAFSKLFSRRLSMLNAQKRYKEIQKLFDDTALLKFEKREKTKEYFLREMISKLISGPVDSPKQKMEIHAIVAKERPEEPCLPFVEVQEKIRRLLLRLQFDEAMQIANEFKDDTPRKGLVMYIEQEKGRYESELNQKLSQIYPQIKSPDDLEHIRFILKELQKITPENSAKRKNIDMRLEDIEKNIKAAREKNPKPDSFVIRPGELFANFMNCNEYKINEYIENGADFHIIMPNKKKTVFLCILEAFKRSSYNQRTHEIIRGIAKILDSGLKPTAEEMEYINAIPDLYEFME